MEQSLFSLLLRKVTPTFSCATGQPDSKGRLAATPARKQYTTITRDGTKVAYGLVVSDATRPVFIVPATGGPPHKVCDDCGGRPSDWSPDGMSLLLARNTPPRNRISLLDIASGRPTDILASPNWSAGA